MGLPLTGRRIRSAMVHALHPASRVACWSRVVAKRQVVVGPGGILCKPTETFERLRSCADSFGQGQASQSYNKNTGLASHSYRVTCLTLSKTIQNQNHYQNIYCSSTSLSAGMLSLKKL